MVSNQLRYCWILYSNNQSNDRLLNSESRSNTVASTSSNARTSIGNVRNTTNSTFKNSKAAKDDFDGGEEIKLDSNVDQDDLDSVHLMLEPNLRPAPPDMRSDLSRQIFEEHKQLAKEYLKIHTDIAYVTTERDKILSGMDPKERKERLEICNKLMEKEELLKFQANLKRQLELIRMNTRPPPPPPPSANNVPTTAAHLTFTSQYNRQNSGSSVTANEDGWVMVSSQNESEA